MRQQPRVRTRLGRAVNEIVREFLLETYENLAQLDIDLLTLEKDPAERETLARVFRTLHTVKGTSGFLGLTKLQSVTHAGENLLSRLRAGELTFNPEIATALLGVVDAIRTILASIEATEQEGDGDYSELIQTMERLTRGSRAVARHTPPVAPTPPAAPTPPPPPPPAVIPPPTPPPAVLKPSAPPREATVSFGPSVLLPAEQAPLAPPPTTPQPQPTPTTGMEPVEVRSPAVADTSIRVDVGLLDKLMNLVGELVLARNQIVQYGASQEDGGFVGTVQRLNLLTTELQAGVMKTRMQPIGNVWAKFPRLVRDLAVACDKQVRIDMDGQETELDKSIIESIRDPLTHMIRNAVDHGIELPGDRTNRGKPAEGRVQLHAFHEGGKVIIEIVDDGGGIDPDRVRAKAINAGLISSEQASRLSERELLNLIFLPGFSTTDRVTQFSGRGVGMDVVRTNIEKIGGAVEIASEVGRGTTVRMKIPLTLAIIPALTISTSGDRFAIPQVSLLELVRLEGEQATRGIERVHGVPVYRLRGNLLPLVYLHEQLKLEPRPDSATVTIVVLQADERQFGLIVDDIHDTEEIVVKPLQKQLKAISAFSGATIMGDGRVALILDVVGLAQISGVLSGVRERSMKEEQPPVAESAGERQTVLLFASRRGERMAVPLNLVARLEEFPRSVIERTGSKLVVQYRGEILPLVRVDHVLRGRGQKATRRGGAITATRESVQVVVVAFEGQRVGLVVGKIIDIVEETIVTRSSACHRGVLFNAVIQDRVTEFLDIEAIVRRATRG
jgi:two-component system chemotaxis sensor kinase CheA